MTNRSIGYCILFFTIDCHLNHNQYFLYTTLLQRRPLYIFIVFHFYDKIPSYKTLSPWFWGGLSVCLHVSLFFLSCSLSANFVFETIISIIILILRYLSFNFNNKRIWGLRCELQRKEINKQLFYV